MFPPPVIYAFQDGSNPAEKPAQQSWSGTALREMTALSAGLVRSRQP
ncbi:MAG: hypothetical protein ACI8Z1_001533 [Candidatus Azotimanducaceae bacterium]|jgi:hypothetical protein